MHMREPRIVDSSCVLVCLSWEAANVAREAVVARRARFQ